MTTDLASPAHVAGRLYGGLAAASVRPTAALVGASKENPLLVGLALGGEVAGGEVLRRLFDELWTYLEDRDAAETLQELRIEHCRLFQGPPRALVVPYESAQAGGAAEGTVRSVEAAYREAGLAVSPEAHDRPDHVAAELEFLAALSEAEGGTGDRLPDLAPADARRHRERFIEEHAGRWLPDLGLRVSGETRSAFYRIYGRALAAAFELDRASAGAGPDDRRE